MAAAKGGGSAPVVAVGGGPGAVVVTAAGSSDAVEVTATAGAEPDEVEELVAIDLRCDRRRRGREERQRLGQEPALIP
jgi:hypothetical protein